MSVHVLAILGALVWPAAAWPQLYAPRFRGLALALWAVTFVLLVAMAIEEGRHFIRRQRIVSELGRHEDLDQEEGG